MAQSEEYLGTQFKPVWGRCDLNDFSKLDIREGKIHFKLYQQDGSFMEMSFADTQENRLQVSWIQIHDRY